jgi:hypothetical protein
VAESGFERFKFDPAGYRAVLRSSEVEADLRRRAQRVKASAEGTGLLPSTIFLLADTTKGKNRVGATVIGVPMRLEVAHRILGRAIDTAR